ncbi:MAG: GxxExxY protein [Saprospiraceae bacterium]
MINENYLHSDLTKIIIRAAYDVFDELGFGFLESVYEKALAKVLRANGHIVDVQSAIPVFFRGEKIGDFRSDLIVDGKVIIELKASEGLRPIHIAQLINYLRATEIEVGLVINFGEELTFKRRVFTNDKKANFDS